MHVLVFVKCMFGLFVYIPLLLHVYLNTTGMPCLKTMNCGLLPPEQIYPTNRTTVLMEKLPQENGDVPGCALLPF